MLDDATVETATTQTNSAQRETNIYEWNLHASQR